MKLQPLPGVQLVGAQPSSHRPFFIFSRTVFRTATRLTERLEEATFLHAETPSGLIKQP